MTYHFGSISHGTMRAEDLIPTFTDELRERAKASAPHPGEINPHITLCDEADALELDDSEEHYSDDDEASGVLEELFNALGEYAPPYGYFGSHPGDGSDYGFWLCEDWRQTFDDDGGLVVEDTSQVPEAYTGEVLHVNDHGNATLYSAQDGKLTEVWSVV